MKNTILIAAFFFINLNIYSQGSNITIELKPDSSLEGVHFSCLKVLDARIFKGNIGMVTRGSGKNRTGVQLPGQFEEYLKETITKLLPKENNNPKLVLIIRDITISENIGTMTQIGFCNVEIEFAKQVDTLLYSLGIFHANIVENKIGIKYSHDKRILKGLETCVRKFDKTDWINNNGNLIEDIYHDTQFDFKNHPLKGAYSSFHQMARKMPLDSIDFDIKRVNKSKKYEVYSIETNEKKYMEHVQFVSDEENIYMRINQTQFIKSISYGKYIYFEGKVSAAFSTGGRIATGMAVVLIGGVVGGAIFAAASSNDAKVKGVVLETETGNLKIATDMYLYKITKEFSGMLIEYRKSKRKLVDKEKVIVSVNSKYRN